MRNKTWIGIFAVFLLLCGWLALLFRSRPAGTTANICQDGVCIRSVDLLQVAAPYSFTVRDADGHENIVEVEPGRIRVSEANCPDQVCVRTGWLSSGQRPIVCLPARLTIKLEGHAAAADGIDGVAG